MPESRGRKKKRKPTRRASGNPARFDKLPLAVDPTVEMVAEAFATARAQVMSPDRVLADALPASPGPGEHLDAIEAGTYLTRVRHKLERLAEGLAQTYSGAQWLWYTRRLSTEPFAGHLITTQFADHGVLEALTGMSRNLTDGRLPFEDDRAIYPCDVVDLRPVAHMASIAVALSQCHSWLRRAGKGTEFVVGSSDLPEPCADDWLEHAIATFDDRLARDLRLQWHPSLDQEPTNEGAPILMGITRVVSDWTDVPGWRGRFKQRRMIRMSGQFYVHVMTLGGLVETVAAGGQRGTAWWQPHTPSLVVLLQALWYDAVFLSEVLGMNLPKVGYLRRKHDYAEWVIDQILPVIRDDLEVIFPGQVPTSGGYVIETLEKVGPDLWPVQPGPVVRALGDTLIIDAWAATSRLHHDVLVPPQVGGELVNSAAFRFETVVQERINRTPWCPTDKSLGLTRGTIRIQGQDLTDIDAVAERDGTLLLVSCKNLPFSPAYDSGEHRVVRNAASTVDNAVQHWKRVQSALASTPVGDNFDLSGYKCIRGVVVTPRVVYSRDPDTLGISDSGQLRLRNAVSLGELVDVLASPDH